MKRISLVLAMVAFATITFAQNVQLHYDFGENRKMLTSTVEMFRPDNYGSTFFFIDMEYGSKESNVDGQISTAYWEIARGFKTWDNPFEVSVEYNGGIGRGEFPGGTYSYAIANAWLFGGTYTWNTSDFSKILNLQAKYKYITVAEEHSFQLTAVWTLNFFDGKVSALGFADFWKEETTYGDYVFMTEPQFWYNFNERFALGTEIEITNNFGGNDGFMVNPTLAVKYNF